MRTAYFIALHHKPNQFRWLFEAIYNPEDVFCIHVDHKSTSAFTAEIRAYIGTRPNVAFLKSRPVIWGGWSQVAVELEAIQQLLGMSSDWKYYINLSGQDYPLRSMAQIKQSLQCAWPNNFIRVWDFEKVRSLEPNDPHLVRRLAFEAFGRLIQTKVPLPFPRSLNIKYKGSNWHMLTREFCGWATTHPVADKIASYARKVVSSDEVFFQALIMNGPFKDRRMPDSGRFVIWPGPKILRTEDYPKMLATDCMFARKFDEATDREVLMQLAKHGGHPVPTAPS